ncbi:MAG: redoxin domain-containing protein [Acidobacteria bacterium]|nr:redoxin domain-containing protein [Acidobacteriota bacterium]
METVLLIIRLILFGVFAVAGISKILDPDGAKKAMRDFGMPDEFTGFFAVGLPFAEIVFAVCFLFVSMSWVGAAGALLLLTTFIGGMIWQMAQGNAPDCHCFGQIHSEPVGRKSLIRNIVFALLAVILLFSGRENQGLDLATTSAGMLQMVLILFLVILGLLLLGFLVKVAAQQNEIMRRLGVLEVASAEPGAVERNEAGDPSDGLPIGAPLPDFAIPDLNGREVRFEHLLTENKPFLFLFVGSQCAPCEALLPEITEWEAELAGKVRFVFISHGDVGATRDKFGATTRVVLLEKATRAFANQVGAKWTPTALFVDANGHIASHLAAGDTAIRRLAEQIKSRDLSEEFVYFLGLNGNRRPNIGEKIPEFTAQDIQGRGLSRKDFIGRETLVAFSSPTCGHCVKLMEEVREWEKGKRPASPALVIFSDGDHEEMTAGLKSPVIVDKDSRLAARFGMRGVPSAVLVDETGTIVTEAAIGSKNIWSLIGGDH